MTIKPQVKRTPTKRIALVTEWYDWMMDRAETFKGELGMHLAYLWPAILKGTCIEVEPNSEIVKLLREQGVAWHATIFEFIALTADCAECGNDTSTGFQWQNEVGALRPYVYCSEKCAEKHLNRWTRGH
jgi:endogenous inhibitor of DNA gyrase (YacG/DUF329 family)